MRFLEVALSLRRSNPAEAQDRPVHFLHGPFPSALEEVGARHRGAREAPCPENQDASTRHSWIVPGFVEGWLYGGGWGGGVVVIVAVFGGGG